MIPVSFVKTMELYENCRLMVTNKPYDSVVLMKFADWVAFTGTDQNISISILSHNLGRSSEHHR